MQISKIKELIKRDAEIEKLISEGKPLPENITKNFIVFKLHDDPYSKIK